jgi:hypothetical protein
MTSHTTARFRKAFQELPKNIQNRARKSYRLWKQNPYHKSLHFKQIHKHRQIHSVRVALGWRAVGVKKGDHMIWFWIGSHAEYDKLISLL